MAALLGEPLLLPAVCACLLAAEASDPHQNLGLVPRAALRLLGALPPTTRALSLGQHVSTPSTCFVVNKGLNKLSCECGRKGIPSQAGVYLECALLNQLLFSTGMRAVNILVFTTSSQAVQNEVLQRWRAGSASYCATTVCCVRRSDSTGDWHSGCCVIDSESGLACGVGGGPRGSSGRSSCRLPPPCCRCKA